MFDVIDAKCKQNAQPPYSTLNSLLLTSISLNSNDTTVSTNHRRKIKKKIMRFSYGVRVHGVRESITQSTVRLHKRHTTEQQFV